MKPDKSKIISLLQNIEIQNIREAVVFLNYGEIGRALDILAQEQSSENGEPKINEAYELLLEYTRYEPSGVWEKLMALFSKEKYD